MKKSRRPEVRNEAKFTDHTGTIGELKPKVDVDKTKIEIKSVEETLIKKEMKSY